MTIEKAKLGLTKMLFLVFGRFFKQEIWKGGKHKSFNIKWVGEVYN